MSGSTTIAIESASENTSQNRQTDPHGGSSASTGYAFTRNMQEHGRQLLMPEEVLAVAR